MKPYRRKRSFPTHLADILGKSNSKVLKVAKSLRGCRIWSRWEEIVSPTIAEHAQPIRWQRKVLVVAVDHSAWLQELAFLKATILQRIQEMLPTIGIKDIRFELGKPEAPDAKTPFDRRSPKRQLDHDDHEFIALAAEQIRDSDIREAARKAMERAFERMPQHKKS
jgi:hypothetical protein